MTTNDAPAIAALLTRRAGPLTYRPQPLPPPDHTATVTEYLNATHLNPIHTDNVDPKEARRIGVNGLAPSRESPVHVRDLLRHVLLGHPLPWSAEGAVL
ncbi:hypothetical protein [Actinomadura oligospora]|uniref:hypothetical protein n=1 Tax=Actinomadura oligospora TaxID=111804 RepID=UPI0004B36457|nr:hypothetical protein [Actinomadura oligospora]